MSWDRVLCLSQIKPRAGAPQHRQHEVILPVGISCPLNTDWRHPRPPPHPWAPGLTKRLGHSLPGSARPYPPGSITVADVGQVSPSMAESEAMWAGMFHDKCSRHKPAFLSRGPLRVPLWFHSSGAWHSWCRNQDRSPHLSLSFSTCMVEPLRGATSSGSAQRGARHPSRTRAS